MNFNHDTVFSRVTLTAPGGGEVSVTGQFRIVWAGANSTTATSFVVSDDGEVYPMHTVISLKLSPETLKAREADRREAEHNRVLRKMR